MQYYAIARNGIEIKEYGTYCSKKTLILVMKKIRDAGICGLSPITRFENFGGVQ